MKQKKNKYNIFISVMSSLTVLFLAVGVTLGYFSSRVTGTVGDIDGITALVGQVTFSGGNNFTTGSKIEPPWTEEKTFTLSMSPSDVPVTVYVKMNYTNDMPDLEMTLQEGENEPEDIILNTTGESTTIVLVTKTFQASILPQSVTYTLSATLPYEAGNENQGKRFDATLYSDFGESEVIYYNNDFKNGTTNFTTN